MKHLFLLFLLIIGFQTFTFAQDKTQKALACPTFSVEGINYIPKPNERIVFKLKIDEKFDTSLLKLQWFVSRGKILNGQETSTITTLMPENGETLTATIIIQGLPENCTNTASETLNIDPRPTAWEVSHCPSISINSPTDAPRPGDKIPFKVILNNYFNRSNLEYNWSVSSGKILSGQGTPSIIVEGTELENTSPTATIEIEGLPKGCRNILSETAPVCSCVTVILVNEYQKLTGVEENKKLDTLIAEMRNSPAARGFIQKSFPSGQSKADVYQHLKRILDYLKIQDVDVNTITFGVAYGKNIEETRLYLIPPGADEPADKRNETLNAEQLAAKIKSAQTSPRKKSRRKN